jgi:hypothetical protein
MPQGQAGETETDKSSAAGHGEFGDSVLDSVEFHIFCYKVGSLGEMFRIRLV